MSPSAFGVRAEGRPGVGRQVALPCPATDASSNSNSRSHQLGERPSTYPPPPSSQTARRGEAHRHRVGVRGRRRRLSCTCCGSSAKARSGLGWTDRRDTARPGPSGLDGQRRWYAEGDRGVDPRRVNDRRRAAAFGRSHDRPDEGPVRRHISGHRRHPRRTTRPPGRLRRACYVPLQRGRRLHHRALARRRRWVLRRTVLNVGSSAPPCQCSSAATSSSVSVQKSSPQRQLMRAVIVGSGSQRERLPAWRCRLRNRARGFGSFAS